MYGDNGEDKERICTLLLQVLQNTRCFCDLETLEYVRLSNCREEVIATFIDGGMKSANVSLDSGAAMILDIVRQLM